MKKQPNQPDERKCFYPDCLTCYCEHNKDCKYDDLTTNANGRKFLKGVGYALLIMAAVLVIACTIINHLFHECNL